MATSSSGEDDDDAGKEASVSEASRAVDETLAAVDEDGFVQTAGGLWTCLVSADADLVRHVTAHDTDAIRDLEKNHGATVVLPSSNAAMAGGIKPPKPGSIMLVAPSKHAAVDAKRDLEFLTHRALRSPMLQYTHFVNIPLILGLDGEALVGAIRAFTRHVLSSTYASGCAIDPSIVTEPGHAHLTLCMLKLYSDEARAKAVAAMACVEYCHQVYARGPAGSDRPDGQGPRRHERRYVRGGRVVPQGARSGRRGGCEHDMRRGGDELSETRGFCYRRTTSR